MVSSMLWHYVESGDVQMAVSALIVLGDRAKGLLTTAVQLRWYLAYIDVLEALGEFVTATWVVRLCPLTSVQELSTDQTFVSLACGACGSPTGRQGWACERCRELCRGCGVCGQAVRGLFAWCRGCEHGGHPAHLKAWFESPSSLCPSGCGHRCEFSYSHLEYAAAAV